MIVGCEIVVNETGTRLKYKPGLLIGGKISHDCGTSRSIGWFLEGILPMALFCKEPLVILFTGVTNDSVDMSVDMLKHVTLPLLRTFGVNDASLNIKHRGAMPKGGGLVEFRCPVVKSIQPINAIHSGKIRRVRGVVFCAKISPTVITRVIDSCKKVLSNVITDVFISSDHFKGLESGLSAGYSIFLMAESTTGSVLSIERTARHDADVGELPETIGQEAALMLLSEIVCGGVIDRTHQPLLLQLMVLGSEDVCKIRFGRELTDSATATLRLLKDAFGVVFKIKNDTSIYEGENSKNIQEESDEDEFQEDEDGKLVVKENSKKSLNEMQRGLRFIDKSSRKYTSETDTLILSCLGTGYINMSRRVR